MRLHHFVYADEDSEETRYICKHCQLRWRRQWNSRIIDIEKENANLESFPNRIAPCETWKVQFILSQ